MIIASIGVENTDNPKHSLTPYGLHSLLPSHLEHGGLRKKISTRYAAAYENEGEQGRWHIVDALAMVSGLIPVTGWYLIDTWSPGPSMRWFYYSDLMIWGAAFALNITTFVSAHDRLSSVATDAEQADLYALLPTPVCYEFSDATLQLAHKVMKSVSAQCTNVLLEAAGRADAEEGNIDITNPLGLRMVGEAGPASSVAFLPPVKRAKYAFDLGYYLAMEAMGHGVGWADDHAPIPAQYLNDSVTVEVDVADVVDFPIEGSLISELEERLMELDMEADASNPG